MVFSLLKIITYSVLLNESNILKNCYKFTFRESLKLRALDLRYTLLTVDSFVVISCLFFNLAFVAFSKIKILKSKHSTQNLSKPIFLKYSIEYWKKKWLVNSIIWLCYKFAFAKADDFCSLYFIKTNSTILYSMVLARVATYFKFFLKLVG